MGYLRLVALLGMWHATYGVATICRLLKIIGLSCRIWSLLQGSFAKETYNFKEPTNRSHPIPQQLMQICGMQLIQICAQVVAHLDMCLWHISMVVAHLDMNLWLIQICAQQLIQICACGSSSSRYVLVAHICGSSSSRYVLVACHEPLLCTMVQSTGGVERTKNWRWKLNTQKGCILYLEMSVELIYICGMTHSYA